MSPDEKREEGRRLIAFYERTKDAHMLTLDAKTGRPLFAHHMSDLYRLSPASFVVTYFDEPTPETRLQEERTRTRMMFSEIDAYVAHKNLPATLANHGFKDSGEV